MSAESGGGIKKLLVLALVVSAAVWGFSHGVPEWRKVTEKEEELTKLTVKNFAAATEAEGVLVVVNVEKEDSEESKTLESFLEELEKRDVYSDKVLFAEVIGEAEPELAKEMGADVKDPRGHLGFYAGGTKLGELVGETDPQVIQSEIERYLEGLIKRVGPGWLPEVKGMQRVSSGAPSSSLKTQKP